MLPFILAALTPTADALSCLYGAGDAFPSDRAVGVPLDVIPRLSLHGQVEVERELVLIDEAAGAVVPTTAEVAENPGSIHLVWLHPDSPLLPGTDYSIAELSGGDLDSAWRLSTFTTGDAALTGSPEAPVVLDVDRDRGRDMWDTWDWIRIGIGTDSAPATYLVQVASSADFSDAREVHVLGRGYKSIDLGVGYGTCGGTLELERGDDLVRVAAVDYAGNTSEYSEPQSAGCSTASGASSLSGVLLGALALLGVRRRLATTSDDERLVRTSPVDGL